MGVTVGFCYGAKRENSTKQLTISDTYECNFKNGCSMLRPTLFLELNQAQFPSYTAFHIGNRYYTITDIRSVRNNLFEISGEVDVLATYKLVIGGSSQYVTRSSAAYDGKIMDGKYPTKADVDLAIEPLSDISSNISYNDGTYVVGLKSRNSNNGLAFYAMSQSQFADFVSYLYSDLWLDATDISVNLQKMLVDPFDYIVSCTWYPFTITGRQTNVYFGFWDWTGHQAQRIDEDHRIKAFNHAGTLPDHPQISRGAYLNAAPYTKMYVDLYAFGKFIIDPNRFLDSRTYSVQMAIDLFTGIGTVKVFATTGTVYKATAKCGVPILLSQSVTDLTKPLVSLGGAAASVASENYIAASASVIDAVKSGLPQVASIGAVGSVTAYTYNPPEIEILRYKVVDEDNANLGRPLCQKRNISSLGDYIQCENISLEVPSTQEEKRSIISYMERGFFYE